MLEFFMCFFGLLANVVTGHPAVVRTPRYLEILAISTRTPLQLARVAHCASVGGKQDDLHCALGPPNLLSILTSRANR
eukprot:899246-Amphidinium_carterae.1